MTQKHCVSSSKHQTRRNKIYTPKQFLKQQQQQNDEIVKEWEKGAKFLQTNIKMGILLYRYLRENFKEGF